MPYLLTPHCSLANLFSSLRPSLPLTAIATFPWPLSSLSMNFLPLPLLPLFAMSLALTNLLSCLLSSLPLNPFASSTWPLSPLSIDSFPLPLAPPSSTCSYVPDTHQSAILFVVITASGPSWFLRLTIITTVHRVLMPTPSFGCHWPLSAGHWTRVGLSG